MNLSLTRKHITRWQNGASLLEAAITLPVVMILLLAAIDLLRYGYSLSSSNFIVSETARWGSLSNSISGIRQNKIVLKNYALELAQKSGISINLENISVCGLKSETCRDDDDLMPGEQFIISLTQNFRIITLVGTPKEIKVKAANKVSNA